MIKKTSENDPFQIGLSEIGALSEQKRLGIKEIRAYVDELNARRTADPLPDWTPLTLGQRFAICRRLLPSNQQAKLLGKSESHLRRYEIGSDIPFSVVAALAGETELPLAWLATGKPGTAGGDFDEFARVPRLDVRASAGGGALTVQEGEPTDFVAFRGDWLRRLGVSAKNVRTMFAHGDSMEPTIRDGDLLLVDHSIDRIVDHGIYVVVFQGMVLVKRVQLRRDGTLVLSSDNERYEQETVAPQEVPEIHVAGRVRWYGRTI